MFEIRKQGDSKVLRVCTCINQARKEAEELKRQHGCNMVITDNRYTNNWVKLDKE